MNCKKGDKVVLECVVGSRTETIVGTIDLFLTNAAAAWIILAPGWRGWASVALDDEGPWDPTKQFHVNMGTIVQLQVLEEGPKLPAPPPKLSIPGQN